MTNQLGSDDIDIQRLYLICRISIAGLITVVIVSAGLLILAYSSNPNLSDATQILGPVTAVVGTLVGTIAGHHGGVVGKEKAEARGRSSSAKANYYRSKLAAELGPGKIDEVDAD